VPRQLQRIVRPPALQKRHHSLSAVSLPSHQAAEVRSATAIVCGMGGERRLAPNTATNVAVVAHSFGWLRIAPSIAPSHCGMWKEAGRNMIGEAIAGSAMTNTTQHQTVLRDTRVWLVDVATTLVP